MRKVTVKELREQVKEILAGEFGGKAEVRKLFKGYSRMKKEDLEAVLDEFELMKAEWRIQSAKAEKIEAADENEDALYQNGKETLTFEEAKEHLDELIYGSRRCYTPSHGYFDTWGHFAVLAIFEDTLCEYRLDVLRYVMPYENWSEADITRRLIRNTKDTLCNELMSKLDELPHGRDFSKLGGVWEVWQKNFSRSYFGRMYSPSEKEEATTIEAEVEPIVEERPEMEVADLDEEYSDYAGDNAHPEEDIPLDREESEEVRESHEVKKEESAMTQAVAPKLFAVGQQFKINRRGTWTVQKRAKCFVIIASGFTFERCKVREDKAGNETIVVQRRDVLGRSDIVKASDALVSEPAVAEVVAASASKVKVDAATGVETEATAVESVEALTEKKEESAVVKPKRKKSRKSKSASTEGKSRLEKIVEAVKAAETQEAIEKTLSECTKKELHEVLKAECGASVRLSAKTERKAEMVESYARQIMRYHETEPFRKLDFEGKYEHLTSAKMQKKGILSLIFALKWDEVKELCERLGVNPDMDREYLPLELIHKLRAVCKSKRVIRGR